MAGEGSEGATSVPPVRGVELEIGSIKGKPIKIKLGADHIADILQHGDEGVKRAAFEGIYKIPVQTTLMDAGVPEEQAIELSAKLKQKFREYLESLF